MPLIRISLRRGKSPEYLRALTEQIYLAMRETFDVPEEDKFMTISEHDEQQFVFGAATSASRGLMTSCRFK